MLIDRGFTLVRPLAGGLEAWVDAGYAVDAEQLIAIRESRTYERVSSKDAPK